MGKQRIQMGDKIGDDILHRRILHAHISGGGGGGGGGAAHGVTLTGLSHCDNIKYLQIFVSILSRCWGHSPLVVLGSRVTDVCAMAKGYNDDF